MSIDFHLSPLVSNRLWFTSRMSLLMKLICSFSLDVNEYFWENLKNKIHVWVSFLLSYLSPFRFCSEYEKVCKTLRIYDWRKYSPVLSIIRFFFYHKKKWIVKCKDFAAYFCSCVCFHLIRSTEMFSWEVISGRKIKQEVSMEENVRFRVTRFHLNVKLIFKKSKHRKWNDAERQKLKW